MATAFDAEEMRARLQAALFDPVNPGHTIERAATPISLATAEQVATLKALVESKRSGTTPPAAPCRSNSAPHSINC